MNVMHEAAMIAARLRRFPVLIVAVEREKKRKTVYAGFGRGTGTPEDKDEVNKRGVCECEG
jgi:hypothetical protein